MKTYKITLIDADGHDELGNYQYADTYDTGVSVTIDPRWTADEIAKSIIDADEKDYAREIEKFGYTDRDFVLIRKQALPHVAIKTKVPRWRGGNEFWDLYVWNEKTGQPMLGLIEEKKNRKKRVAKKPKSSSAAREISKYIKPLIRS